MKTLYLMQGIPGSGKSTIARLIRDMGGKAVSAIFSTDELWYDDEAGRYNYDPALLGVKHRENQRRVIQAMIDDTLRIIIIDNTNITRKEAKPYVVMAEIFGFEIQVVRVSVSVDVAKRRQSERPFDRRVPDAVIESMATRMQDLTGESGE